MGMSCCMYRLSDEKIFKLKQDSTYKEVFIDDYDEDDEREFAEIVIKEKYRPGFWGRLFGKKPQEGIIRKIQKPSWLEKEKASSDCDKAWNLIFFGLNKETETGKWPASFLLDYKNGDFYGNGDAVIEVAYSNSKTREIAEFLSDFSMTDFMNNMKTLNEDNDVYLAEHWDVNDPEEVSYVTDNYYEMKKFILETADFGFGILIIIC